MAHWSLLTLAECAYWVRETRKQEVFWTGKGSHAFWDKDLVPGQGLLWYYSSTTAAWLSLVPKEGRKVSGSAWLTAFPWVSDCSLWLNLAHWLPSCLVCAGGRRDSCLWVWKELLRLGTCYSGSTWPHVASRWEKGISILWGHPVVVREAVSGSEGRKSPSLASWY